MGGVGIVLWKNLKWTSSKYAIALWIFWCFKGYLWGWNRSPDTRSRCSADTERHQPSGQQSNFDKDYFDHLASEIQKIRARERRFHQKISDIYATAVDYSLDSQTTKDFFATVQNKMHRTKSQYRRIAFTDPAVFYHNRGKNINNWLNYNVWKLSLLWWRNIRPQSDNLFVAVFPIA